jgi:NAD+ synthase
VDDVTGFSKAKCDGFVVALSGGLDSAVITRLLQRYCDQRGTELKIAIMGEGNHDTSVENYQGTPAEWVDIQYAKLMCTKLGIKFEYLDISEDLKALRRRYTTNWAKAGQKPRVRANHLYAMAEEHDLISVGATNASEFILAAFSTGGPAGNIAPLADLYKTEVYAIARDIGMPKYIQERKSLISELNIADYSLYGGGMVDSTIIDPIIRRLWFKKQEPKQIAKELGHSERWIADINEKRIKGETCRRNYKGLIINRGYKFKDIKPDLVIDRSYFI